MQPWPVIRNVLSPCERCAGVESLFLILRTARYTIVGMICATAHNVVMILGDLLGRNYVAMMFLSFVIVSPIAYLLHCAFTFNEQHSARGLLRFYAAAAVSFLLFLLLMVALCTGFGVRAAIATPIVTVTLFLFNFVSAHWAIVTPLRLLEPER